jgi:hypothetical protein
MLLIVAFFSQPSHADDSDTADFVRQQVVDVAQQLEGQIDRITAIERYLADQARAKEGKAPSGWAQPPLEDYLVPGAPESLIPVPPAVAATSPAARVGPQP